MRDQAAQPSGSRHGPDPLRTSTARRSGSTACPRQNLKVPFYQRHMVLTVVHELGHSLGLKHHHARCAAMSYRRDQTCPKPPVPWQYRCRLIEHDDLSGVAAPLRRDGQAARARVLRRLRAAGRADWPHGDVQPHRAVHPRVVGQRSVPGGRERGRHVQPGFVRGLRQLRAGRSSPRRVRRTRTTDETPPEGATASRRGRGTAKAGMGRACRRGSTCRRPPRRVTSR